MGFNKSVTAEPPVSAPTEGLPPTTAISDDGARGKVRMHAIIGAYRAAALLAPTLANTRESIVEELHRLAIEIAAKVEAYSFAGPK